MADKRTNIVEVDRTEMRVHKGAYYQLAREVALRLEKTPPGNALKLDYDDRTKAKYVAKALRRYLPDADVGWRDNSVYVANKRVR